MWITAFSFLKSLSGFRMYKYPKYLFLSQQTINLISNVGHLLYQDNSKQVMGPLVVVNAIEFPPYTMEITGIPPSCWM